MSITATPNDTPILTPIQPLHHPTQAAHVVIPQAPLGNVANQAPGLGAKALLNKKMSKSINPTYISPTDKLMTPCTQKLTAAKRKQFAKKSKPVQLFAAKEENSDIETGDEMKEDKDVQIVGDDEENPF